MALFGKIEDAGSTNPALLKPFWHQLLVIPEATLLCALLLIGWAFKFPVAVSLLTVLVVGAFLLRVALLSAARQRLRHSAYEQADRLSSIALRLHPWSVDALQIKAETYVRRGDDGEAELLLRRAAALAPHQHAVHTTLTATLLGQGQHGEARQVLERVRSLGQLSPHACQQLAWYTLHVEKNATGACLLLEGAAPESLPADIGAVLLVTLAEAQLALHDAKGAQAAINALVKRIDHCPIPQQAELYYHVGRLETELGADACASFRKSVALDPNGRFAQLAWRSAVDHQTPTH